jgi:hypothetical protein
MKASISKTALSKTPAICQFMKVKVEDVSKCSSREIIHKIGYFDNIGLCKSIWTLNLS